MRILLVEDNPGDATFVREAFAEAGWPVELQVAEDGESAIAALQDRSREQLPQLILLDLNLPCKQGREVLAEIKSNPRLQTIPTIVLSSSVERSDVNDSYQSYANCYLMKPGTFDGYVTIAKGIAGFWSRIASLPVAPRPHPSTV